MGGCWTALDIRQDVAIVPLSLEHAPNMFLWMCDPVVNRNLGLRDEPSLAKTSSWIINTLQDSTVRPFAVLLNDVHVGNVILDRLDRYLATARLSVYIGAPSTRQKGVGLAAIFLALSDGFGVASLHKVWLTVHPENLPAIKTYRRLGFVLEGILRDEFWLDGKRTDVLYFGLLKHEFQQIASGSLSFE